MPGSCSCRMKNFAMVHKTVGTTICVSLEPVICMLRTFSSQLTFILYCFQIGFVGLKFANSGHLYLCLPFFKFSLQFLGFGSACVQLCWLFFHEKRKELVTCLSYTLHSFFSTLMLVAYVNEVFVSMA